MIEITRIRRGAPILPGNVRPFPSRDQLHGLGTVRVFSDACRNPFCPVVLFLDVRFLNSKSTMRGSLILSEEAAKDLQNALLNAINEVAGSKS